MRASWNWLNEFVDLDGIDPHAAAERLSLAGLEVETVEAVGAGLEDVVAAKVVALVPHPDAERLRVATVDRGDGTPLSIVCGAPNVAEGHVVPLAPVGSSLPNGMEIRAATLRGVESNGMLCSAEELGLDDAVDGLLILPEGTVPGTPIGEVLGMPDHVIELSLTPNRADCLSMLGIARELAVLLDRPMRRGIATERAPKPAFATQGKVESFGIRIDDSAGCPRYAFAVVRDVTDGPSPAWMQQRLRACGVRPVSRIVDATNYAMLENGQPLHAFDLDTLEGDTISVRGATPGERMESIDHVDRALDPDDLVIADGTGAVAVAGVMGGVRSEVSAATTAVLIECAHFQPSRVRRGARRHGLHTEASHRFERGVDPAAVPECLRRAVELIALVEAQGGGAATVSDQALDLDLREPAPPAIAFPEGFASRHLGIDVSPEREQAILSGLGFAIRQEGSERLVTPPAWRFDIARPIDLVEEVARVVGYDAIPPELPPAHPGVASPRRDHPPVAQAWQPIVPEERLDDLAALRRTFAGRGFSEAVHMAFADSRRQDRLLGEGRALALANPLGEETATLRRTLLDGLLRCVRHNRSHGAERIALFECGRVFPGERNAEARPEPLHLAAVLCGAAALDWTAGGRRADAWDLRGVLDAAASELGRSVDVLPTAGTDAPRWLHPGVQARLVAGGEDLGWIGGLHPELLDAWELPSPTFALELNLDRWLDVPRRSVSSAALARYPGSSRDCALLVSRELPWSDLASAIEAARPDWLESYRLFDVYEGANVPEGQKSLAIRMHYRNPEGTLVDEAVERLHADLLTHLERSLGATQRA